MRLMLATLAVGCLALAACGGDDTSGGGVGTTTSSMTTGATTTTVADVLADQYGIRYCEVLTVSVAEDGTTAEVWGTQGVNDCPQENFDAIDPDAVAAELGVTVAVPNGPRFWVLDRIVANQLAGSGEVH